jgi:hypothetical protein
MEFLRNFPTLSPHNGGLVKTFFLESLKEDAAAMPIDAAAAE